MPEGTKRKSEPQTEGNGESEELAKRLKLNNVVWEVEDPSEFRKQDELKGIGKDVESFRVFTDESDPRYPIVKKTYTEMHAKQTVSFVKGMHEKWDKLDKCEMTIMDALFMLDSIIDESDPDTELPNSMHCFQTAERIRQDHPDREWFQLTGLIHDLGKVLACWGEPQFCVVGDTFPVGCAFSDKCVFPDLFKENPDSKNTEYNTEHGMYKPNCGLKEVLMSYGHDEYLYQVLVRNKCRLPDEALYCVRYHSFYPWHNGGAYDQLCDDKDRNMLKWIREFNKYDLYSKADNLPKVEELKPYYQALIDKYIPGKLKW